MRGSGRTASGRRGTGESGQAFPLLVVGLMLAVLVTWGACRAALTLCERTQTQTAVDATAISAANCYARGLNVVAITNRVLFGASVADFAMALLTGMMGKAALPAGASFTDLVMEFQNMWAGLGKYSPGIAPAAMEASGRTIGRQNGLAVSLFWNGRIAGGERAASLNVRRASVVDLIVWLAGGKTFEAATYGPSTVYVRKEKLRFSYRPSGGGRTVEVPEDQVEKVTFKRRGKTVTQYRMKRQGAKAGRFVKATRITRTVRFMNLPLPLIEISPVHEVLVLGASRRGILAAAGAEAGGGEVFSPLFGEPDYRGRLVKVPPGIGDAPDIRALMDEDSSGSPDSARHGGGPYRRPRWARMADGSVRRGSGS